MWKGRFQKETSSLVQRYGESVSFDWRLYPYDIQGSIAHAEGLARIKIITRTECDAIRKGLNGILADIEAGNFEWKTELEDVHMNIESELTRRIGAAGAKLHTARSRNDQIALDARLFCRAETQRIIELVRALQRSLVAQAEKTKSVIVPGYTHLQRGQPVLFGHHLLAYVEMLERDAERLTDALKRINVMPLGSGALAGSTIVLDRAFVAERLGFPAISGNSMDAVSDRDFMAELMFAIALCGMHLSRLSEDIILWVSAEFGFITLSDAHTTGSSLMPQKKNPDVAELTRGKTGRLYGNLFSLLTTLKGLPMTYNRDMQEDKERLFDSVDTISLALEVFAEMTDGMSVNAEATRAAASDPLLLATDLADWLVLHGVPFRQAHEVIGKLVAFTAKEGRSFDELTLEEYRAFSPAFDKTLYAVLSLDHAVKARGAVGAPSEANVAREIASWKKRLAAKPAKKTARKRSAAMLRTDDFDYDLPPDLIASRPPERRDASRMLVVHRVEDRIELRSFVDFPEYIRESDLVILNNTRVVKARFFSTDGKNIELLRLSAADPLHWRCMAKPGKKLKPGKTVQIGDATGTVLEVYGNGDRLIEWDRLVNEDAHGHLALPHYMERDDDATDTERYQTVFADAARAGAIAAPTAGLHFTPEILAGLRHTFITLHVGVGTFQPVRAEFLKDHVMHSEHFEITPDAAQQVESAKRRIAVGTTVTRVLEHCAATHGRVTAHAGSTDIFIYPPYQFQRVDALLTNFHLPKSTLFMLVCAFAGTDLMKRAYAAAVAARYRFYSYGDCMLIL